MSRAVQYGDFLAKAVMYDHLTKNEGLKEEKAMERVTEEFVNYNLLPGRTRSYAESMGLTWFWAYKIRSLKIAHRHLRDNPFRALLMNVATPVLPDMPGVSVGSPITDNFLAATVDGRIGSVSCGSFARHSGHLSEIVGCLKGAREPNLQRSGWVRCRYST